MIYSSSPMAVVIFLLFIGMTVGISFYLGKKAKSSHGYFAAHGQIPWFVNGVAFAGDYLSVELPYLRLDRGSLVIRTDNDRDRIVLPAHQETRLVSGHFRNWPLLWSP